MKFILHNDTDGYFVQAALVDSTYYVTGHTENEADATVFVPVNKHIIVKGVEDDAYSWTETASDKGYTLLKEAVKVVITTAEGGTCDVCHKSLLTASATVNGNAAEMSADGDSVNAVAQLTVVNTKRMIISYMVDRVDVYRDYRLKITFKIRIDRLLKSLRALERSRRSIDRSRDTVYNEAS